MSDLPIYSYPMSRTDPLHPPAEYAKMRSEGGVALASLSAEPGRNVWLITRFSEAKQVLADTRFSSDSRKPGFPVRRTHSALIRMDPPEHTHYRRMLTREFSAQRMASMRPIIQKFADDLIDSLRTQKRPVDLVPTLALPLPSMVICHLMGVPYEDHGFLQERSAASLRAEATEEEIEQAVDDLGDYMRMLVQRKKSCRQDDLLGRLITDYVDSGACSLDAAASVARLLLVAGHVTTVNMIGIGVLSLVENPEQLSALRQQPDRFGDAVEELLRFLSITATLSRVATVDVEIGGRPIKAGDGVMVLLSSANRDCLAFDHPDTLDISRDQKANLAFGWGPHLCIGAPLARLELEIVFRTLFERIPNLKVASSIDDIPFRHKVLIYGVHALPITW